MPLRFVFVPPKVDARVALHAMVPAATHAAAEVILGRSQPLVPVDSGELKASGKVIQDGERAVVSYTGFSGDGYDYGARQHEDLALHHPNGGQAKYLEQPMSSTQGEARDAILAQLLRAVGL